MSRYQGGGQWAGYRLAGKLADWRLASWLTASWLAASWLTGEPVTGQAAGWLPDGKVHDRRQCSQRRGGSGGSQLEANSSEQIHDSEQLTSGSMGQLRAGLGTARQGRGEEELEEPSWATTSRCS